MHGLDFHELFVGRILVDFGMDCIYEMEKKLYNNTMKLNNVLLVAHYLSLGFVVVLALA
jgi:hypothetical protein